MLAVSQRLVDYTGFLPPQDSTHAYRLVGFIEYSVAIDLLDKFLDSATSEERKVAEEIVLDREEFVVVTNLSRKFQGANSFLSEAATSRKECRKHGLDWVTALARVEVGAMLAGFTSVSNPFQVKGPTKYDLDAYKELLADGYRCLYWMTVSDPVLNGYAQSAIPADQVLIQGRRLALAKAFGQAAVQLLQPSMTPVQVAELTSWNQQLQKLEVVLLYCLSTRLGTGRGNVNVRYIASCPPLAEAARQVAPNWEGVSTNPGNTFNPLKIQLELQFPELISSVKCE